MKRLKYLILFNLIILFLPQIVQAKEDREDVASLYKEYYNRFESAQYRWEIKDSGFCVIENQIFPIMFGENEEIQVIPAIDEKYGRIALFFSKETGEIIYRTEQLEANNRNRGRMEQPNKNLSAISFQDLNGDGRQDIVLIASCVNKTGAYADKPYKVGDVLFQNKEGDGFYRDYRISDKVNKFGMNKSAEAIIAFVRDGYSTEFMYTATTLSELQKHGLKIIDEQCYSRSFAKLGKLMVVPATYKIADYEIFMIYLVNEQDYIVSSLQPMGDYDNLYALKGINCRDIDGDGLKDIVVLARYSYEGENRDLIIENDYSIYYQRTGGFSADTDIRKKYLCGDEDKMEDVVKKAREYWGWKTQDD